MSVAVTHQVRSMTGQGGASGRTAIGTVRVELRTVNHRGFKCSSRLPDALAGMETKLEAVVRRYLRRGSVNLSIALESDGEPTPLRVNQAVLADYVQQFRGAIERAGYADAPGVILNVAAMGSLEGVLSGGRVDETQRGALFDEVRVVLQDALQNLVAMRQREGARMAEALLADCAVIHRHVQAIEQLAPQVAEAYRVRLEAKVKRLLSQHDINVETVDLLREVQLYADKADISEELTRLDSHLDLFRSVIEGSGGGGDGGRDDSEDGREQATGRKLDFIIQEMFRETNTIGSKSASSDVSALVVEIKCAIERMRELVQNLE